MKKYVIERVKILLGFLFVLCVGAAFCLIRPAAAEEKSGINLGALRFAEGEFAMAEGASVRVVGDGKNGLRFIAGFKDGFDMTGVTAFGMLIGPQDLIEESLDMDDFSAGNAVNIAYTAKEEAATYLFDAQSAEGVSYKVFGGSLSNIYIGNYDRVFTGLAYYVKGGETFYAASGDSNDRSAALVAGAAMKDPSFQYNSDEVKSIVQSYADKYQVQNGSFVYGLSGWTAAADQDGLELGFVVDRVNAGKDGVYSYMTADYGTVSEKLFSFANTSQAEQGINNEEATGTLTSSPFIVGENAWLTLSWGGSYNGHVSLQIRDYDTDKLLFGYDNSTANTATEAATVPRAVNMAGLGLEGKAVYLVFDDNGASNSGYGGIVVSDIVTCAAECPAEALDLTTTLRNGSFTSGLDGWTASSDSDEPLGFVVDKANAYFGGAYGYMPSDYGTVSAKLFSFANTAAAGEQDNNESVTGTLISSPFFITEQYINMSWGGGVNDKGDVRLEVREYGNDSVLETFYNHDNNSNALQGATIKRSFDVSAHNGKLVYLAFVDEATANDYGGIVVSDIVVNAAQPLAGAGYSASLANGHFDGGLNGWTMTTDPSSEPNASQLGFVVDRINAGKHTSAYPYMCENYNTIGAKLFSFANTSQGAENINMELATGTLRSSEFVVNPNAWLTLSWGGGANGNIYLDIYKQDGTSVATYNNVVEGTSSTEAATLRRAVDLAGLGLEGEVVYIVFRDTPGKNYSGIVVSDITTTAATACPEGYTELTAISSAE